MRKTIKIQHILLNELFFIFLLAIGFYFIIRPAIIAYKAGLLYIAVFKSLCYHDANSLNLPSR